MGRFVKERYSGIREYLLNLIRRCAHEQFCVMQAYKHIFTSPSSVEKEPKATRSGNARIHGMTQVTLPSIAYVATQV
jgi:hypothetical protein